MRASWSEIVEGPVLVVSPHLDDAALSCAAVLGRPERVDVLTIFAGEPDPPQQGFWDYECGFRSSAESIPARRAEEESAFAGTPHRLTFMELLEGQYVNWQRTDEDAEAISEAVRAWAVANAGGTVLLPAGAGRRVGRVRVRLARMRGDHLGPAPHPDHLFVRDVALRVLRDVSDAVPALYEELPYLLGGRASREVRRAAAAAGWKVAEVDVDVDRVAKAARIAAYETQVPFLTPAGMRLDVAANLPASERYWRLSRRQRQPESDDRSRARS